MYKNLSYYGNHLWSPVGGINGFHNNLEATVVGLASSLRALEAEAPTQRYTMAVG